MKPNRDKPSRKAGVALAHGAQAETVFNFGTPNLGLTWLSEWNVSARRADSRQSVFHEPSRKIH